MSMTGMMRPMRALRQDTSVLKETIRPGTTKRMLRFAAPYAWLLALFLLVVVLDATIGIAEPLIYRDIINNGILRGNATLIVQMAALIGILALFDSGLGLSQSYLAAKIGTRIVLSMRTKLFAHIQQMPSAG
jgi:ATP-binding cassette, subfamily B, bacterial